MIVLTLPYPEHCVEFDGARHQGGYGAIRHEGKTVRAHRLAYCQAHGLKLEAIAGQSVRHRCDNPGCVNPAHLELGSHTDNMRDMAQRARNRQPKGERNAKAKLTADLVKSIRARRAAGESMYGMARQLQLNPTSVLKICQRKTWRHVA
jgi:hypothetical protein